MYGLVACIGLFLAALLVWKRSSSFRYAPGPYRWPVAGNAFQVSTEQSWLQFSAWGREFGDMVYLRIFSRSLLILNSTESIKDLFEKKSSNFSDRPRRVMGELSGFGPSLVFKSGDESVRQSRKLLHSELNFRAVTENHAGVIEENARRLCLSHIQRPEDFLKNIQDMAVSIIMRVAYGHVMSVGSEPDELTNLAKEVMRNLSLVLTPNKYLVDGLPFLRFIPAFFPGAKFQNQAAQCRDTLSRFWNTPFERVVEQMKSGNALPSLISNGLKTNDSEADTDPEILKKAAGDMYGAGTDTNISAISSFFLAMTLHRNIQQRAQEEILSVIGPYRLPLLADRPNLPFVNAIVQEVFRWNPALPFGKLTGHSARVSDVYRGFDIPAGTLVIANIWGLLHDEKWYPDPLTFNPSRHLSAHPPPVPTTFAFGWGRRSCPGYNLAESTVFMAVAMTLATCDISPPVDTQGNDVLPSVKYTSGMIIHPMPFQCRIVPRSPEALELLLNTC
ncbi:cytochrome P450 [Armillaria novae-zelandiae]|uniref:Cytochrome P450 n=1 Tax=Armillaria novae-zelandiae TaxID=153914 RepID=A0AA39TXI5_9AGAR|nr:cytochrome P450 [Armillaria novae-zelandiae]